MSQDDPLPRFARLSPFSRGRVSHGKSTIHSPPDTGGEPSKARQGSLTTILEAIPAVQPGIFLAIDRYSGPNAGRPYAFQVRAFGRPAVRVTDSATSIAPCAWLRHVIEGVDPDP